jgi:hypothetical protein
MRFYSEKLNVLLLRLQFHMIHYPLEVTEGIVDVGAIAPAMVAPL